MVKTSQRRSMIITCCFSKQEEEINNLKTAKPKLGITKSSFRRLSFSDISNSTSPEDLSLSLVGSNLYVFTLLELKFATQSFSTANFLGEGGFGPVFKGFIDEKARPGLKAQPVAVKVLDLDGAQGHKEWLAEVIFLGQLRHPHLVKLIGYCCEDEQRLLVYEFMAKGSLENHLFKRFFVSLPWTTRLKIAVGAAKGLAFLHETEKPVIYRDFKASNILLDSEYKAKLSDFGLAKDGPEGDETHVSTRVMGTQGYAAPEYIMTGHLTTKSDVYSFGVVLMELLTGRKSTDKTRPVKEQNLVEFARPYLKDERKLTRIMDPSIDGQYSTRIAMKVASIAYQCLSQNPKSRPQMSAIVDALEPLEKLEDMNSYEPFVYTITSTTVTNNNNNTWNELDDKEDGNEVGFNQQYNGHIHKLRSPKTPGFFYGLERNSQKNHHHQSGK